MLQTFRPKDKERIIKILDEAEINMNHLLGILEGEYGRSVVSKVPGPFQKQSLVIYGPVANYN